MSNIDCIACLAQVPKECISSRTKLATCPGCGFVFDTHEPWKRQTRGSLVGADVWVDPNTGHLQADHALEGCLEGITAPAKA